MFQITLKGTAAGYGILALGYLLMMAAPFAVGWVQGMRDLGALAFELLPGMWPLVALCILNCGVSAAVWTLQALGTIGKLLAGMTATVLFVLCAAAAIAGMWEVQPRALPAFSEGAAFVPAALAFAYAYLAIEVFVLLNRSGKNVTARTPDR